MRKMGPLGADNPLVQSNQGDCNGCGSPLGDVCPGCDKPFEAGDYITLVVIGPGGDREAQAKAREGRYYNAITIPAHWACVTGERDVSKSQTTQTQSLA
jgi:hypothetical protein